MTTRLVIDNVTRALKIVAAMDAGYVVTRSAVQPTRFIVQWPDGSMVEAGSFPNQREAWDIAIIAHETNTN